MNPYAVAFFSVAFLILPLKFRFSLLLDQQLLTAWSVSSYGLPLIVCHVRGKSKGKEKANKPIVPPGIAILSGLRHSDTLRRILRGLLVRQQITLRLDLRFQDAALRALSYAALDTVLRTLKRLDLLPRALNLTAACQMQQGEGGAKMTGIFHIRLGSLLFAGALLRLAMRRASHWEAPKDRRKLWSIQSTT